MCRLGVSNGTLPNLPFAVEILYASATSILFHLAVVRPHQLKPSYFKFMNRITGDRYDFKFYCSEFCILYITLNYKSIQVAISGDS